MKTILAVIAFLSLATDAHYGPWSCGTLNCYLKEGKYTTSPVLHHWTYRTCASMFGMSCETTNDRVPSRCQDKLNKMGKDGMEKTVCNAKRTSVPMYPGKLTVKVTKMGIAQCKSATNANNWWMDKDGKGVSRSTSVCCTKYKALPWLPAKVYNLPC